MARYIDADKLLAEIQEELDYEPGQWSKEINKHVNVGLKIAYRDINSQPTADVEEVRHGDYKYDEKDDKWRCSECSAERPLNNGDIAYSEIYCCYKCGAKMDGERKKNDKE